MGIMNFVGDLLLGPKVEGRIDYIEIERDDDFFDRFYVLHVNGEEVRFSEAVINALGYDIHAGQHLSLRRRFGRLSLTVK